MNWSSGIAAIVLRDAVSNVVDCVFYQRSVSPPTDGSRPGTQTGVVPRPEWPGFPITNTLAAAQTLQRTGGRDRNSAADWHFAAATLGKTHAGLTLPFERGIGSVLVIAPTASVKTDGNGYFNLPLQLTGPASNVVLFATASVASLKSSYSGQSMPFQLGSDVCLTLTVPASLSETAGTLADGIRVTIPTPRDTNVIVGLQLPDGLAEGVTVPEEIIIPAGATEATGPLTVMDNAELTGPRSLPLTATAAGYAPTSAVLVVQDDERAALRLEPPPSLMENSSTQGRLFIDPPPSRPVAVTLSAGATGRLNFFSGAGVLGPILVPAGSNQVPVGMLALDNQRLEGPTNVTVRASFADWTPAEATLRIDDDETNTITVQPPAEVEEGDRNIGINVVLGGTVDTNVVLTVTVEPEILVAAEPQATVIAGQRERGIGLNAIGGNETKGDALVTIHASAPGWHDGVTTMLLLDDNPARFAVHVPRGPVQAGETFIMRLRFENINGRPLSIPIPEFMKATVVGFGNDPVYLKRCTNCTTPPNEGVDVYFSIGLVGPSAVVHVEADGVAGDSDPVLVWSNPVPTALLDGVYDEARGRLVLATQFDAIRAIDPATGNRSGIIPFGRAYLTALADDGQTLYLALLDGSRGVGRANLASLSSEALWLTEPAEPKPDASVMDLLPLPGRPKSVLVAQRTAETELTLTVYDDTVPRKETVTLAIPAFGTRLALLPGLLDGQIFVSAYEGVTELAVTATGIAGVPSAWEIHPAYDGGDTASSALSQGLMLDGQAELIDPALPGRAGAIPLTSTTADSLPTRIPVA
ncbi:MAG TPA: hypothetical protein VMB21_05970 [Candidatus Limnocylindria bacterium]|nr:hypothetical protein [Candidatus Limnocylindria bacterium]